MWQRAFLFPLIDIDSVNSPRAWDKVLGGMCKHYRAQSTPGPKYCFSTVYSGAMATHHGVDDYLSLAGSRDLVPLIDTVWLCGFREDLGVAMCAGHQLLPGMRVLTCPLSHCFPEKTMDLKAQFCWRKVFLQLDWSLPFFSHKPSETSGCCTNVHRTKCEIGDFT